jgi:arylsulfatase A-like enzyme
VSVPNVLLVVLDAARRDALEPYGAPPGSSPTIDALARRGHALAHAYATSSWTLPSHASMFTGELPRTLGLAQAPDGTPAGARPTLEAISEQLLPSVLRDAGYATHGFSANLWASGHAGFDLGFDSFTYVSGGRNERLDALPGGRAGARLAWALEGARARADDGAAELGVALKAAIDGAGSAPTFWFVNLVECHSPYLPPRPWNDLGIAARARAALDAQRYQNFESICLYAAGRRRIRPAELQRMRHLYGRAIAYMDAWLGEVLGALERRGLLDDTLVIVTADHGENFGEGGLIAHGFGLSEPLIHVPLVIAGPGAASNELAFSLADLPGLIASAAGIEDHQIIDRGRPEGIAIAQYDALAAADDPRIREFAQRFDLDARAVARLTTSFTCATDGERKLIISDTSQQRYDLRSDPGEHVPLGEETDEAFEHLRSAIERYSVAEAAVAPVPAAAITATDEERAALERQMKLLGYL